MKEKDFLLEIGTAELPPTKISNMVDNLARILEEELKKNSLSFSSIKKFSSPRRLAILISDLIEKQPDQPQQTRGPSLNIAFDPAGNPTKAALKFAETCHTEVKNLGKIEDKKGTYLFYQGVKKGEKTEKILPLVITDSIKKIIPQRSMRWGKNIGPFVRPIYWIVAMFGEKSLPVEIFAISSSSQTFGHRFHHPEPLTINNPATYEKILEEQGFVITNRGKRKQKIIDQIKSLTKTFCKIDEELLEEVTDIVEWPSALIGKFDKGFLKLPPEILTTTLKKHQKCFPVFDENGKISSNFIVITNIDSKNSSQVIEGNERVIQARLVDADFFYKQDTQHIFENNIDKLKDMAFQKNLGSLYDKTLRLEKLVPFFAKALGADEQQVTRAAKLSKCDLVTSIVWEFPELQGVTGYYYTKEKEGDLVANIIKEQYLPRFATDAVPTTTAGAALALADRIDSLTGLFYVSKNPGGDKDPLGLRRLAAGIIKISLEKNLSFNLEEALDKSLSLYDDSIKNKEQVKEKLLTFILERLRSFYLEQKKNPAVFRAVLAKKPTDILDFNQRVEAVTIFNSTKEAPDLIETYKRIKNILSKAKDETLSVEFDFTLAIEPKEKELAEATKKISAAIMNLYKKQDYTAVLQETSQLKPFLAAFFEKVIVMSDDKTLKKNRLTLLHEIYNIFDLVADLSCLLSG